LELANDRQVTGASQRFGVSPPSSYPSKPVNGDSISGLVNVELCAALSWQRGEHSVTETAEVKGRFIPAVLIIVPAYNEEESIPEIIRELCLYFPVKDILVVDDGSTDGTSHKVLERDVNLLRLPCNLGVGAALQAGLKLADEWGYDYTLRLDGDGQHDPEDSLRLLYAVMRGEADVAIGSRFIGDGGLKKDQGYRPTTARVLGIRIFAITASLLTGKRITDPTSGQRCYSRQVIRYLARYQPQDYPEIESTILLHRAGFSVVELPATMRSRLAGKTSIDGWKAVYYAFRVLLAAFIAALRTPLELPEEANDDKD
jgi:glycosyltransferase involved in cell wall biosynthesis